MFQNRSMISPFKSIHQEKRLALKIPTVLPLLVYYILIFLSIAANHIILSITSRVCIINALFGKRPQGLYLHKVRSISPTFKAYIKRYWNVPVAVINKKIHT
jgi:hypothetical protein